MKSTKDMPELVGGQEASSLDIQPQDRRRPLPYTTGQPVSTASSIANFASGDYDTFARLFFRHLRDEFGERFDNMIASDPVFMIGDMIALAADSLSFKLDQYIGETFLDTVREKKNAYKLARQYGYTPKLARAAGCKFIISLPDPINYDITIPAATRVRGTGLDGAAVTFELYPMLTDGTPDYSRDIMIPAGRTSISNVIGLEGSSRIQRFEADGRPAQYFIVQNASIINDSIRFIVGGTEWERVQWFGKSYPQQGYKLLIEPNSAIAVIGDGKSGAVPPAGTPIRMEYREGGGTNGNVATGSIRSTLNITIPGTGITASCSVVNYSAGTGGAPRETIREIKSSVARIMSTQNRGVTAEDYASLCVGFASPGNGEIGRAIAALRHAGCSANIIDIYVLARIGERQLGQANDDLKADLSRYIDRKKMLNTSVCIRDGSLISQNIEVQLIADPRHRRNQAAIEEEARVRVEDFMDLSEWDFGEELRRVDIIRALAGIEGVVSTDVVFGENDFDEDPDPNIIRPSFNQIVRPGDISVHVEYL